MAEWTGPVGPNGVPVQAPDLTWASAQVVAYTGTAGTSTAITARLVRVVTTSNAWVQAGASPTAQAATAGSIYSPANVVQYIPINSGWKVSAIQDTASGNMSVTPCAFPN